MHPIFSLVREPRLDFLDNSILINSKFRIQNSEFKIRHSKNKELELRMVKRELWITKSPLIQISIIQNAAYRQLGSPLEKNLPLFERKI